MATKRVPQPKRRMSAGDRKFLEKAITVLERARDVISDPATPETKVARIGALLEAFKYRRPPEVSGLLTSLA